MSKRAEAAAMKAYPPTYTTVKRHAKRVQSELVDTHKPVRAIFQQGYEQAEKDIIFIIESRLSELLGDAQPTPILRYELQDLIKKIKEENNG